MKFNTLRIAVTLFSLLLTQHALLAQDFDYSAGTGAGANITTGDYNAFIGYNAGNNNTAGGYNAFVGSYAGYTNNGFYNNFFGAYAGYDNTTGNANCFYGWASGTNNTTGGTNSFYGQVSGYSNTTGQRNSFFGAGAGYHNTNASDNAFYGQRAGYNNTASNNTFFGSQSGEKNTVGLLNTFVGRLSGFANTSASSNTFVGAMAGSANTTGGSNTFVGTIAGDVNTTGAMNTFIGQNAGGANTTGGNHTFVGQAAGAGNTTGLRNTYIGTQAGEFTTSGSDNVAVGRQAGRNNTTGSNNTTLGNYAQLSMANLQNACAIGNKAIVRASNSMVLGSINGENGATATIKVGIGTSTPGYLLHVNGTAAKPGGGAWTVASDKRLKKNIQPFTEGLNAVTQINPVWFQYNGKAGLPTDKTYVGVIAQDMQKIAPYTINEFTYENEGQTEKYLDYDANALMYAMVNAVKELNEVNKQQSEQIKKLIDEIAVLKGQRPANTLSEGAVAKLWQNSPNPYASSTIIKYYIPEDVSDAQIRVISVTGQEVYSRQLSEKGESQIEISNQMLSTGSYVYQLIVNGNIVDNKKMILSK